MTEKEKYLASLLARCSFLPGHWHKKFARNITNYESHLTSRQRWFLYYLVKRYRKQTGKKAGEAAAAWLRIFPSCPEKEVKKKSVPVSVKPEPNNTQLKLSL